MTLLQVADGLYGLPPAQFTAARDAAVVANRAESPELTAAIRALRKPTTAAWVVNLLVRRDGGQVGDVLAVGAAMREAQASLDGAELRALTSQRRQLTAALTTRARRLASEVGVAVSTAVAEQVEATLTAAVLDASAAEAVQSGLLVTALRATGVDTVDVQAAVATPEALGHHATPDTALRSVGDPDATARAAAKAALVAARRTVAQARRETERTARQLADRQAEADRLTAQIEELRSQLAATTQRRDVLDAALTDAESAHADAVRALAEAEAVQRAAEI
ncbi:hypothetical protein [Nocardioides limicola]|uniref:hypothetical protein n=1 Tax=Nocardioides limicola TaxID=2803368 RepID=UPI00193C7871|nr:hypothetical protein [Nocardioides sp. DJM-14]